MKHLLVFIVILVYTKSFTQDFSSDIFHDGFLVTMDQDTVKGDLKYDLEANVILLVKKGKTQSYSSHKVYYFEIYDQLLKNYRQFYSIPFNVSFDYKIPIFFELVYEGKLSLLQRESIIQQTANSGSAYWGGGTVARSVVVYDYYFLDSNGKIQFFSGKKKDLFGILTRKQSELKNFIKNNKLDTDEIRDLIRITAFYNSI